MSSTNYLPLAGTNLESVQKARVRPTAVLVCPHWVAHGWHVGPTLSPEVAAAAIVTALSVMTQACGQLVAEPFTHLQQTSAFSSHFLCENAAISTKPNIGQREQAAEIRHLPNLSVRADGGQILARTLSLSEDLFLLRPIVESSGGSPSFNV